MLVIDVNVLIDAYWTGAERHGPVCDWIGRAILDGEPLAIPGVVASGFMRVATNRRVFRERASIETTLAFLEALLAEPRVQRIEPGPRHWAIFSDLCQRTGAIGNHVPDAWIAAIAIENHATLITGGRGFDRYPGLRWRDPVVAGVGTAVRAEQDEPAASGDAVVPPVDAWQRAADAGHERRQAGTGALVAEVPGALLDEIVAWCLAGRPNEACGLLAGPVLAAERGSPTRFLPLANAALSPHRYLIDPQEQLRAILDIEDAGEEVWAIAHSHVASPAVPSDTDVGLAGWPDALYLICSLASEPPHVRAWSIREGAVAEVDLVRV